MDFNTNIQQTLKLQQNISPQMLQSLFLLPMSCTQLNEYLKKEVEENPAFSIESFSINKHGSSEDSDNKQQLIENVSSDGETLSEHLLSQLNESRVNNKTKQAGEMLIGNLDKNGFFIVPLDILFEKSSFKKEEIQQAVKTVQSFDPNGICVADYKESLILQAKLAGLRRTDLKIFSELINNCLELLNEKKFSVVASQLGIEKEDVQAYYDLLKTFTPFPGRNFDNSTVNYIVPEFSVHNENGTLLLKMNNDNLPDLEILPEFCNLSDKIDKSDKQTERYIKENIRRAKTLIAQVKLRYATLFKTASVLVELQKDFFLNGPEFLKILTLQTVASLIETHESTVSRLIQNKYIETDWGLFPLKYFFSQGVSSLSRTAVKKIIALLISQNKKLSDRQIAELLSQRGINCSRRTVAKYRSESGFQSSFKRRSS